MTFFSDSIEYSAAGTLLSGAVSGTQISTTSWGLNTKGSWAELTPSSPVYGQSIFVQTFNYSDVNNNGLMDIGFDEQGSTIPLIDNLKFYNAFSSVNRHYFLPIENRRGNALRARVQSDSIAGPHSINVVVLMMACGLLRMPPLGVVESYGQSESSSRGTEIDCGSIADTKGAWTQITASTLSNSSFILITLTNRSVNFTRSDGGYLIDIGIGSSGSEQIILENIPFYSNSSFRVFFPAVMGPLPFPVRRGTRIAARGQCPFTGSNDTTFDISIYCIG